MNLRSAARRPSHRAALLTALGANVAVAVAKGIAAAITGSSAVLAESLHSVADSVNEILLLIGARRAGRPADLRHPFGHARYRYLYAFVVSLAVFWIGGVLSVLEGVDHLLSREVIVDPRWRSASSRWQRCSMAGRFERPRSPGVERKESCRGEA